MDRAGYKAEFPNWMPGNQVAGSVLTNLNRKTVSDNALRYRQAQDNWITANLRKESGAAIPVPELEAERAKWFPLAGEGDETIRQKAAARVVAEEAMQVQMGPGRKQMRGALERTAPKEAGTAEAQPLPSNLSPSSLQKGKTYTLPNGKAATGTACSLGR
ncbi:hypothetical protein HK414_13030 [Ramlibacter terrae]|uniref:Uncharacterized protein n=1 Tax=Ramlibacter terrae TaxID=2732511 RepID=A0ABX6P2U8_9BURK|nr:hypothetical protein HK414_13030 [Ramlibacter terrae]